MGLTLCAEKTGRMTVKLWRVSKKAKKTGHEGPVFLSGQSIIQRLLVFPDPVCGHASVPFWPRGSGSSH
jgi:hypothetical protein